MRCMLCSIVVNEVNINKSNCGKLSNTYKYRKTDQATIIFNS